MNDELWQIFTNTGSISDYLAYKGIESGDVNGNVYPEGDSAERVPRG